MSAIGSYLWNWGNPQLPDDSSIIDDENMDDVDGSMMGAGGMSEDEMAERMLSQFPPYGTNKKNPLWDMDEDGPVRDGNGMYNDNNHRQNHHHSGDVNNDNDDDGQHDAHIMLETNPSLLRGPHYKSKTSSSTSPLSTPRSSSNTFGWDPREERLWKTDNGDSRNSSDKKTKNLALSGAGKESSSITPRTRSILDRVKVVPLEDSMAAAAGGGVQYSVDDPKDNLPSERAPSATTTTTSDRQHWMPDKLCKQCYACDLPFTVFRRRHHCRLCGQVFCSNCSAYFVTENSSKTSTKDTTDGKKSNTNIIINNSSSNNNNKRRPVRKTSRACELCYDTVQRQREQEEKQLQQQQLQQQQKAKETPTTSPISSPNRDANNRTYPFSAKKDTGSKMLLDPMMHDYLSTMHNKHYQHHQQKHLLQLQQQQTVFPTPCDARETALIASSHSKFHVDQAIGRAAATHLRRLGEALLESDAPQLWKSLLDASEQETWVHTIMTLATKCCRTVNPNVQKGDLLDIRPYVKIKVIPGGSSKDCAYLSGVAFRKQVAHKRMAKETLHPKILLLNGGIEFTRTENRIASLETLLEQEDKYTEILVSKILKLQPNVLLVGRSVSRRAQELLLQANVVLLQHVKPHLMKRIARQTGATVLSSTDHVMNQFGVDVLGKCHRFRIVTFRDNEIWMDQDTNSNANDDDSDNSIVESTRKSIPSLLQDQELVHHERQAALAANRLGESVLDGTEAIKMGLAKRGVARSYVLLEGCPKHLGCTVVLRGASKTSLKQVKRVFRFLVNVAYNLRLETSYLRERCARLPLFVEEPRHLQSSSLCVDYGNPPAGRKGRPWNGTPNHEPSMSGKTTALDHQSILITSVWMTEKAQCCPAEVKGICYYSLQDVSLGHFLRDSCFNLSLKCQNPSCKKSVLDHSLSFVHNDGLMNITVEHMDDPLPSPMEASDNNNNNNNNSNASSNKNMSKGNGDEDEDPIATWTYCVKCQKVVTPLVYISEDTWKFSFGKFLEVSFYNRDATMNCGCNMQSNSVLYFGCGRLAARFTHEVVKPFNVYVRKHLAVDPTFHRTEALRHLENISNGSSVLFVKFDKHIEKVSREARELFGSAANRPEHLQTVLQELNRIGSEVDHAAKTLQEKIASVSSKCRSMDVVNDALFRFPSSCRRYLYMLTSAWNERLSAAGQALAAMRKLASMTPLANMIRGESSNTMILDSGSTSTDDLVEGMRRLRMLSEYYGNMKDIGNALMNPASASITQPQMPPQESHHYDDEFDDGHDGFSESVDADVLASRRRLHQQNRPRKSLGTQQQASEISSDTGQKKNVTAGGAVKSALTRFFNRGGKESDPYVVDLGVFKEGRPRLEPGVGGVVLPVVDDIPSTVIAYSLSSSEYGKQFNMHIQTAHLNNNHTTANSHPHHHPNDIPPTDPSRSRSPSQSGQESTPLDEPPSLLPQTGPLRRPGPSIPRHHSKSDISVTDSKSVPSKPPSTERQRSTSSSTRTERIDRRKEMERRMLERNKSHIKHTFRDYDEKGQQVCKFVCTTYWATQFHVVRQAFLSSSYGSSSKNAQVPDDESMHSAATTDRSGLDVERCYAESLSSAYSWAASGGKSGASFQRTADDRFVIKCISRTELQMFLDCAPAYFEYLTKAFFHGLPTVLCKIVGVYQIGYHNRETGKRSMEQVAVMQNIFYGRKIAKTFDLKGSLRGRFARNLQKYDNSNPTETPTASDANATVGGRRNRRATRSNLSESDSDTEDEASTFGVSRTDHRMNPEEAVDSKPEDKVVTSQNPTLLDGDFLEFTAGRPLPLNDRAKAVFQMSVLNDTLFLSIINVLDYSILVGIDEENMELVVGIIDFMRQYDILKQMERVGKSLPMVVGSEAPTIIQPPLYKARFTNAMERYFMTVPSKWTTM